jgi:hypothetical protein
LEQHKFILVFGFPIVAFINIIEIVLGYFETLMFFGGIFFTLILHAFFNVKMPLLTFSNIIVK